MRLYITVTSGQAIAALSDFKNRTVVVNTKEGSFKGCLRMLSEKQFIVRKGKKDVFLIKPFDVQMIVEKEQVNIFTNL